MKKLLIIPALLLLASCDSGTTISIPPFECVNGNLPNDIEKETFEMMAENICGQSAKRYGGKLSCDDGKVIATCK